MVGDYNIRESDKIQILQTSDAIYWQLYEKRVPRYITLNGQSLNILLVIFKWRAIYEQSNHLKLLRWIQNDD